MGDVFLKPVDEKCPLCGTLNRSLDLEETDGWFECEHCGNTVQILKYVRTRRIPVYRMNDSQVLISLSQK